MKLKFIWALAIVSWIFFLFQIFIPLTGVMKTDWNNLTIWAFLSMVWTNNLLEAKTEELEKKDKENNGGL
jgi:hypothetical protein